MDDSIQAKLAEFIVSQVLRDHGRNLTADEALISSGLIDSFSLVDLALFVEEAFGVRIEDTELNAASFDTIGELAALIAQRKEW